MVRAPPRVLPRSLALSGVLGGGWSGTGSPLPGLRLCAPRGAGRWRSCAGGRVWVGGGAVGRGVALPRSVPLPSLTRQQSGCHWRRSCHGGRGPHTTLVRARPPSRGAICAVSWSVGAGSLVPRGSCGSRRLGRGGGPCSGSSLGRGEAGPSHLPQGLGAGAPAACGPVGGQRGGGVAPRPPCCPSGGRPAVPYPDPPQAHSPPACVFGRGRGAAPGGGDEGRPVDRSPGALLVLNPPSAAPEWAMVMGGVMGGAASI